MFNKKKFSAVTTFLLSIFLIAGVSSLHAQSENVVEVVNNSQNHTIFAELLTETGLEDVVSQEGPYTVVAPTDQAFEEMDTDLEEIKADPDRMQNVVISHLFQGEVPASEAGSSLGIEISEGDIPATNGLVHVTGQVIQN